jgi:hypothetical protein
MYHNTRNIVPTATYNKDFHVQYVQLTKKRHEGKWNKFWNEDGEPQVIVHIVQQAED